MARYYVVVDQLPISNQDITYFIILKHYLLQSALKSQ